MYADVLKALLLSLELNDPEINDIAAEAQPLIQPTSTVISYGADDSEATGSRDDSNTFYIKETSFSIPGTTVPHL